MIQNIKKSIFINIFASFIYIELLLIIFAIPLSILSTFIKIGPMFSFISFPICTLPLGIACLIGAFWEVKNSKTKGYIINIPEKITNSLWYNILFWVGIILTLAMCVSGLIFLITILK